MTALYIALPTAFLIVSAILAVRSVRRGAKRSRAFALQLLSFLAVCVLSFALPVGSTYAAESTEPPRPLLRQRILLPRIHERSSAW